jgi:hypothetical protein
LIAAQSGVAIPRRGCARLAAIKASIAGSVLSHARSARHHRTRP